MTDNNVLKFAQPGTFTDSLTEILRGGAHALLKQAVEARSLATKRYVYFWVDGIHLEARLEDQAQCAFS